MTGKLNPEQRAAFDEGPPIDAALESAAPPVRRAVDRRFDLPRTEFRDIDGEVVATATVGDDGVAVIESESSARVANIAATKVIVPGPIVIRPEEGERYLRALPFAFRSPYLHAVFVSGRKTTSADAIDGAAYGVDVINRLTTEQQEEFDRLPVDVMLRPSGNQTPEQARNMAVAEFRNVCALEGMPVPSEVAVEAAIDAAQAGTGSASA